MRPFNNLFQFMGHCPGLVSCTEPGLFKRPGQLITEPKADITSSKDQQFSVRLLVWLSVTTFSQRACVNTKSCACACLKGSALEGFNFRVVSTEGRNVSVIEYCNWIPEAGLGGLEQGQGVCELDEI